MRIRWLYASYILPISFLYWRAFFLPFPRSQSNVCPFRMSPGKPARLSGPPTTNPIITIHRFGLPVPKYRSALHLWTKAALSVRALRFAIHSMSGLYSATPHRPTHDANRFQNSSAIHFPQTQTSLYPHPQSVHRLTCRVRLQRHWFDPSTPRRLHSPAVFPAAASHP